MRSTITTFSIVFNQLVIVSNMAVHSVHALYYPSDATFDWNGQQDL
jgi:hypothetical protein